MALGGGDFSCFKRFCWAACYARHGSNEACGAQGTERGSSDEAGACAVDVAKRWLVLEAARKVRMAGRVEGGGNRISEERAPPRAEGLRE